MTVVKICGLRDEEIAAETAAAGADMIGMVFAESRRQVRPAECAAIVSTLRERRRTAAAADFAGPAPGEVSSRTWFHAWSEAIEDAITRFRPLTVGVFANQAPDDINDITEAAGLDLVQLSGGEQVDLVEKIRRPVILVRHVSPETDAGELLEDLRPGPVAVLLDTADASSRGGTGSSFDWQTAHDAGRILPVLLAGGLDAANVASAIEQALPWGVDVSSGVEAAGAKDIGKIRAFIKAAKGASRD